MIWFRGRKNCQRISENRRIKRSRESGFSLTRYLLWCVYDLMDDVNAYIELIKDNIEYEHHMKYDDWQNKALYEELFEVICEVVCVKRTTIRIAGEDYPYELVKSKFLKLNSGHLEYVIGCMHDTNTKITNIKAYMVTALYNAPSTINHYYQQEVQHDMYGGGWHEKGIV